MNLLISCYDVNNNILYQNEFDGQAFYEASFWQTSDKLGITKMGIEMKKNSKEALELRRNRKITDEEKTKTLASSKLKSDVKAVLEIAITDLKRFEGDDVNNIISNLSGLKIGAVEDINSWFEEIDLSVVTAIEFKKI
ncbi:MAG: hypothetical protein J6R47_07000 [Acholeplasmatales bacterium]|nr:hypothetical protein [Acholeplasmatales bacterium]